MSPSADRAGAVAPAADSGGLELHLVEREVVAQEYADRIPPGTRSVSIFLLNRRAPDENNPDLSYAFQAEIEVRAEEPFVPRPDLRGALAAEWDEQVADLHYPARRSTPLGTASRPTGRSPVTPAGYCAPPGSQGPR